MNPSPKGRPPLKVDKRHLNFLLSANFKWKDISAILDVSVKTLQRRAKNWNLSKFHQNINDDEVDTIVREIIDRFPTAGEVMLAGYLKSQSVSIQQRRLRESIHRIRGHSTTSRRIQRRVYNVPGPNYLWHADGHHKLIRYRLVIHGAIDGFSRLKCSDNNRAETVYNLFMPAIREYGCPLRLRTDKGGENVDMWRHMVAIRGEDTNAYIAGSSVHNCRIERLWRDVRSSVVSTYATVFKQLEISGVLDVENDTDLFCLQYVFIPRINKSLDAFREGWNHHSLSTEGNWSPIQLYTAFSIGNPLFDLNVDPNQYGVEDDDVEEGNELMDVPQTKNPLSDLELSSLFLSVNPLQQSHSFGADLYMNTLLTVGQFLSQ